MESHASPAAVLHAPPAAAPPPPSPDAPPAGSDVDVPVASADSAGPDVAAPPAVAPQQLGHAVAQGVIWTAGAKWGSQLVAWGSTIFVARALTPSDYGIVAMAGIFTDLVSLVCELGIAQGVLVFRDLAPAQVRQLNALAVLLGVAGSLVTALLAVTVAAPLFGNPKLPLVLLALSPVFIVSALRTVPAALLQRELRFRRLAFYDAAQAVILAGSTLALAASGAGYWTLVAAILLGAALSAGGVVTARPVGFARPRLAGLGPVLRLSRNVLASRLLWYAYARADTFIVGRVLGSVALGSYSLAWTVANAPVDKAGAVISSVVPGVFSAAARDRATLGRYFLSFTEIVLLLLAPPCIGLALTAPEFVEAVLGPRWMPMAAPLAVLALFAATRAVLPLVSQVLVTSGQSARDTQYNLFQLLVLPPALWVAAHYGLVWVAATWPLVLPVLLAWQINMALRAVGRGRREFLRALLPAAQACLAVAAAVVTCKLLLPAGAHARARLGAEALAGGAAYAAFILTRHGDKLRTFRALARARG